MEFCGHYILVRQEKVILVTVSFLVVIVGIVWLKETNHHRKIMLAYLNKRDLTLVVQRVDNAITG